MHKIHSRHQFCVPKKTASQRSQTVLSFKNMTWRCNKISYANISLLKKTDTFKQVTNKKLAQPRRYLWLKSRESKLHYTTPTQKECTIFVGEIFQNHHRFRSSFIPPKMGPISWPCMCFLPNGPSTIVLHGDGPPIYDLYMGTPWKF